MSQRGTNTTTFEAKANMVEHGQSSKKNTNKGKVLRPKGVISKKPRFQGKCYNCDKTGHKSADCKFPRRNINSEANVIESISKDVSDLDLSA